MNRPRLARSALFAVLAALLSVRPAVADGFVVLVNKVNPITSISRSDLKRIISGATKQWGSGAVVQIGIMPGDSAETAYLAQAVELTPRELYARIQEQVFKGELRRPVLLHSSAECAGFASSNAGAMCVATDSTPVPGDARAIPIAP
jgi:hypothetical protein